MIVITLGVIAATVGEGWEPAARVAEFLRTITNVE